MAESSCLFVVDLLNRLQVQSVVMKDHNVLRVEIRLQGLALQDRLELLEEVQRVLGARDVFEARVDEALQRGLELGHVHVEFKEVPVESVAGVVQ